MQIITSTSADETIKIGKSLGEKLKKGDIVSLTGPLGAGKTVLIKGIAISLGIQDEITSPSFTLISEYHGIFPLYHIDLYRLDSIYEIEDLGFEDIIYDNGITVIEWGEKAISLLPESTIRVKIDIKENQNREITIDGISI